MLIVTGDVTARDGHFDALFAAARAHCGRSRTEPGCLGHDCYADPAEPARIFFFERWADEAALKAHFNTPGVADLTAAFHAHAAGRGTLQVYAATAVAPPSPQ